MLQFTVPQFIDVEDKIIGTITVRQFIILLVAAILIAVSYRVLDTAGFVVVTFFVGGFAAMFAFVKVNSAPFHYFLLNLIQTFKKPRLRVWRKDDTLIGAIEFDSTPSTAATRTSSRPVYSASRLSELSLIVDTQGSYQGETADDAVIIRDRRRPDF